MILSAIQSAQPGTTALHLIQMKMHDKEFDCVCAGLKLELRVTIILSQLLQVYCLIHSAMNLQMKRVFVETPPLIGGCEPIYSYIQSSCLAIVSA